jgi:hypothetical protein
LLDDVGGTPRGDDLERRRQVSDDYERDDRCNDEQREANIANARMDDCMRSYGVPFDPYDDGDEEDA